MADRKCRRKYVIRLRAETDQFLLSCHKIETFVLWLSSLFAAIDLAPALDDRQLPLDLSVPRGPRRSRRRAVAVQPTSASTEALVRQEENEDAINTFPDLGIGSLLRGQGIDEGEEEDDESEDTISPSSTSTSRTRDSSPRPSTFSTPSRSSILHSATVPQSSSSSSTTSLPPLSHATTFPQLLIRTRALLSSSLPSIPATPTTPTHPSIDEEGKWRPQHEWSPFYDLLYAKRCMAVLTHMSPRKSKYVVVKGKRCIVDWQTGKLEREDPPEYGEWESGAGVVARAEVVARSGKTTQKGRDKEKRVFFKRGGKQVVVECVEMDRVGSVC